MAAIYAMCLAGWPLMPAFTVLSSDGKARQKGSGFHVEFSAWDTEAPNPSMGVDTTYILLLGLF